jgi:predicted DNA-binding transcriptional regulator AlpA
MSNVLSFQRNKDILDRRFVTAKGLQQIFIGLGRSTIDDWAKDGIITRHKIGGCVFYDLAEIETLINSCGQIRSVG